MKYNGMDVSVYLSSFTEGNKVNNYTLLVRKDNGNPVVLHFIGYDRLFGSHYDEYDVVYTTFKSGSPDPSVFEIQDSKFYHNVHVLVYIIHVPYIICLFWSQSLPSFLYLWLMNFIEKKPQLHWVILCI